MVTTIQLNDNVKKVLNRMKNGKETYESVVLNLIKFSQSHKRQENELLIEGCKEMSKDLIKISEGWDSTLMDGINKDKTW
ncbi:hypothetical protein COT60_04070 [Candidatus Pacearchaeota archaeon CG09_land_8_20_14_0_10_30_9]|nr:hypothetical protein [Candidatus Pacearchaeota archaeon]OIO40418.1 MAG: hypothetical protein AUJ61_02060 [Candidatus Pacearchaeota archaeon CG1_02_30_18]PIN71765.1 MAG: hypothetical protein COV77_00315 [Candidatus Pacearchaeota archaeon CG11_big_fil_rev_8_21_14_0_20_30_13]PIO00748.1 MAG: hypothetical protein COT60_04070 [Candidatus Pacearchaeota archaeon CG09_land_8_20_14_0_10_30_9]PIZ82289.1 MAG: hypothetical protein COX98_00315 [Candidatus Pacearchaeota archaeon CG_4_10_14_0_2_um_filter_30